MNINSVTLVGKLVGKVEMKLAGSSNIAKFVVETTHSYTNSNRELKVETTLVPVEAFGRSSAAMANAKAGDLVAVEGRVKADSWKNEETGKQNSKVLISAIKVQVLAPEEVPF